VKILVVNETSALGGAETMALELVNALSLLPGNEVGLVSSPGVLSERVQEGVRFFPISRYRPSRIPKIFLELRAIFREVRPDVVHPQGATIGIIASAAARLSSPRTKIVITHHSARFIRIPARIANAMLRWCTDALIAISTTKYRAIMRDGFPPEKVFQIPNFVDRRRLLATAGDADVEALKRSIGVRPGERVVVGAGRLIPGKRFDLFVTTLAECARRSPSLPILGIILGNGPERERLQDLAETVARENLRIRVEGYQNNVASYLRMADAFLFPSEWREVLPMCLIEAIAMGVPVVCSNIPGNSDIVNDGVNGFLVDVVTRDYAAPLLRLLGDEALARRLSAQGVDMAQRMYDKDRVVGDIFALYRRIASG
jgi:glycosyltransferase EpsD